MAKSETRYNLNDIKWRIYCSFLIPVLWCYGCGIGGGGEGTGPTPISEIYVNVSIGNDLYNDGSNSLPYKTISKALKSSLNLTTIKVAPGTYDASIGEVFPLILNSDITLVGDEANQGGGSFPTVIKGVGSFSSASVGGEYQVAITCSASSKVSGFTIIAPVGTGIWSEGNVQDKPRIVKNSFTGSAYGVVVAGYAQPNIDSNQITANNISGIETFDHSKPVITKNNISNNKFGIVARNFSQPDVGTSSGPNPGLNNIVGNTDCDLNNTTDNQISAIGNSWDADTFLFTSSSICTNGSNIVNTGQGYVLFQDIPSSIGSFVGGTAEIVLFAPYRGALLQSNEPRFMWTKTGAPYVFLGLLSKPASWKNNGIENVGDIVWIWHSGLAKGMEGDVGFYDGLNISNGNMQQASAPTPLQRGRTYYWLVWTWDQQGIKISRSSQAYYFTVAN